MTDVTIVKIDEMDSISGALEGITFRRAASDLGVTSFGISVIDMEPDAAEYPEHDHDPEGIGGRMFAKRPGQLGQEEVYIALRGSGTLVADGEEYELEPGRVARIGPAVKRKVVPGPDGIRLLALGGIPGSHEDASL